MNASSRWPLSKSEQEKLVRNLTANLSTLRAKLDISQDEISKIVGISRQTYSSIEGGKRPMSWQVYLAFVLFFDVNKETHSLLHHLDCFPDVLVDKTMKGESEFEKDILVEGSDIMEILSKLDNQALYSVKTVLMIEYARCSKIPGEEVVKAFDGLEFKRSFISKGTDLKKAIYHPKTRTNDGGNLLDNPT